MAAEKDGAGLPLLSLEMAAAVRDLPYRIPCQALLLCGEKDHAGSCIRYNRAWHRHTGIRLEWIKNAGHNSNTDAPERVNYLIEELAIQCQTDGMADEKEDDR